MSGSDGSTRAPAPIPARSPANLPVSTAIARAASATGADFRFLLAQARLESGFDPAARARTSSASGLFQFTNATWLTMLDRHGGDLGLDRSSIGDPAARARLLALRDDPQAAALMAGNLANDNRAALRGVLGREPDNAELYLAHFLGPDGSKRLLAALAQDPSQSAAALLPSAASANRSIFYAGPVPRSVGQVMDWVRNRIDGAMARSDGIPADMSGSALPLAAPAPAVRGGPLAREFAVVSPPGTVRSMADTLMSAFGTNDGAVPATVRAAYGAIRALGF